MEQNFDLKGSFEINGLNSVASHYQHKVHGSQFLEYHCDDENNFFAIAFRTAPETNNGIAHALEHMIMQGSSKYPISNVFFEVRKRSINSFLNAATGLQYTSFELASMNEVDFHNLMDVYLDAVFHPNLTEEAFMSEVHHSEFSSKSDPSSPLEEIGVVFNEMSGYQSSPGSIFYEEMKRAALSSTSYAINSGGVPSEIAKLKVEDLSNFHSLYYRPSNAVFFHYGSFNASKIICHIDSFLSAIQPSQIYESPSFRKHQPQFSPKRTEVFCPLEVNEDPSSQIRASITWVAGEITDFMLTFELRFLAKLLMGTCSSPLFLSLLKSGIAGCWDNAGVGKAHLPLLFSVGVCGLTEETIEQFFSETQHCLEDIVSDGFLPNQVNAAFETEELSAKEIRDQQGLEIAERIVDQCIEGVDPLRIIDQNVLLSELKGKFLTNNRYFEELIDRVLLKNNSRSEVVCRPKESYLEEKTEELNKYLSEKRRSMTEEEVRNTLGIPEKLRSSIEAVQDLKILPSIKIEDLDQVQPMVEHRSEGGVFIIPQPLNGLVYINVIGRFPIIDESIRKIPLIADLICNLGGNGLSDVEFSRQEDLYTSGFLGTAGIYPNIRDHNLPEPFFQIAVHCLGRNFDEMLRLLEICLFNPNFSNEKQIRAIAEMNVKGLSLTEGIADCIADFSSKSSSRYCALKEMLTGRISEVRASREVLTDIHSESIELGRIFKEIISKAKYDICLHCNGGTEETYVPKLQKLVEKLNIRGSLNSNYKFIDKMVEKEQERLLMEYSTDTNCTAAVFGLPQMNDFQDYGKYAVASSLLNNDFLIREVRQKLGAYDAVSRFDPLDGFGILYSFMDTSPLKVMETFRRVMEDASKGSFEQGDLERAMLTAFSEYYYPIPPSLKGMSNFFMKVTWDDQQQIRKSFTKVTKDDVIEMVKYVREQHWNITIFGNRKNFEVPDDFQIELI